MPRKIESNSYTYFIWIECGWSWCCRHFANLLFCGFWCLHTMRIRYDVLVIIVFHFSTLTPNNCWWRNREIGVVLSKTHMFEKWETTKKCEMRSEIFCLTRNNFDFFPIALQPWLLVTILTSYLKCARKKLKLICGWRIIIIIMIDGRP